MDFPPIIGRWTWPVSETMTFNTEIRQPHKRLPEQRIPKRRGIPESHFTTEMFVEDDNACSRLDAIIHTWLKKMWRVPLWGEAELHQGPLPAGSSSIEIDTRYADFREGGYALIWKDLENYEFVTIQNLTESALTLSGVTVKEYEAAKFVLPVRLGVCLSATREKRYSSAALAQITWRVQDVQTMSGFIPELVYDGYTVLTEPSYLAGDHAESLHDPDVAVLDAGTGPFEVVSNSDYNDVGQPHIWQPQSKQACWELRQFLHDLKGCQKAFLVPTFKHDLTLTRSVGPADKTIYVEAADLIQMGPDNLRKYLAFRPVGLPIIPRKITEIALISEAEERIDLVGETGQNFEPGEHLCWVDLCRLAYDQIEWHWYERGKATVETNLIRVTN